MTGRKIRYSDEVSKESFGIPHILIHWRDMELKGEFHCSCGARLQVTARAVFSIECHCGQHYELPADVELKKVDRAMGPSWISRPEP